MRRNFVLMLLLNISCSIHVMAQTDYYYYQGNKIPLTLNENKVCVSIPKDRDIISERIRENVHALITIKDETFSSDTNIIANQVYVGSHVTNEKPQGPVTVSNGSVKINSFNGVEIVNDFQVQQGATLEINP